MLYSVKLTVDYWTTYSHDPNYDPSKPQHGQVKYSGEAEDYYSAMKLALDKFVSELSLDDSLQESKTFEMKTEMIYSRS